MYPLHCLEGAFRGNRIPFRRIQTEEAGIFFCRWWINLKSFSSFGIYLQIYLNTSDRRLFSDAMKRRILHRAGDSQFRGIYISVDSEKELNSRMTTHASGGSRELRSVSLVVTTVGDVNGALHTVTGIPVQRRMGKASLTMDDMLQRIGNLRRACLPTPRDRRRSVRGLESDLDFLQFSRQFRALFIRSIESLGVALFFVYRRFARITETPILKLLLLQRVTSPPSVNTYLPVCGADTSHLCCSGTVLHLFARRTIAVASISP